MKISQREVITYSIDDLTYEELMMIKDACDSALSDTKQEPKIVAGQTATFIRQLRNHLRSF